MKIVVPLFFIVFLLSNCGNNKINKTPQKEYQVILRKGNNPNVKVYIIDDSTCKMVSTEILKYKGHPESKDYFVIEHKIDTINDKPILRESLFEKRNDTLFHIKTNVSANIDML